MKTLIVLGGVAIIAGFAVIIEWNAPDDWTGPR